MLQRGSGLKDEWWWELWSDNWGIFYGNINDGGSPPSKQQQHKKKMKFLFGKFGSLPKKDGTSNHKWFLMWDNILYVMDFFSFIFVVYIALLIYIVWIGVVIWICILMYCCPLFILNGYASCCKELHNFILMCGSLLNG